MGKTTNELQLVPIGKLLKAIHAQESKKASREKAKAVATELRAMKLPEAAKKVEAGIEETLTYIDISLCWCFQLEIGVDIAVGSRVEIYTGLVFIVYSSVIAVIFLSMAMLLHGSMRFDVVLAKNRLDFCGISLRRSSELLIFASKLRISKSC